jgi:TM2 domain-containing membrane protein YozV
MHGRVLAFDPLTGEGAVGGEDGERYLLTRTSLAEGVSVIAPGERVSFILVDGAAGEVTPNNETSRLVAVWLALLLGFVGAHKLYMRRTTAGLIVLGTLVAETIVVSGLPVFFLVVWRVVSLVEGVIYLIKTDEQFRNAYVREERAWF